MATKRLKRPRDPIQLGKLIVGYRLPARSRTELRITKILPLSSWGDAVASKGDKARSEKMTPRQRSESAKKTAAARWKR